MNKKLALECISMLEELCEEICQCNAGDEYYDIDSVNTLIKKLKKVK